MMRLLNFLNRRRAARAGCGMALGALICTACAGLLVASPAIAATASDQPAAGPTTRSSPFPKGVASSGWIPFQLFDERRIFIPAKINGVRTQVMLDSGASSTVLDAKFVKTLQIKATGHFTGEGSGGSAAMTALHGVDIKLGAITFRDTDSVGIDLSAVATQLGHALPVILGGDAFVRSIVDIDFAKHRIAFRNPTGFAPPSEARSVAVTKAGENFAIQASIEGRKAVLVFDIGNASPLGLSSAFVKSSNLLDARSVSTTKGGGLGGMHVYSLFNIKSLQVAGTDFSDIPTVQSDKLNDVTADGNIGLPILRRFHLLVDLPHDRVLFAPPIDTTTPFEVNHTGLTLEPEAVGQKVLYVAPRSPAAMTGLKAGDVIVTIDGMSIATWNTHAGLSAWIYGAPGRQIRLGLMDGQERPLAFGKYF